MWIIKSILIAIKKVRSYLGSGDAPRFEKWLNSGALNVFGIAISMSFVRL